MKNFKSFFFHNRMIWRYRQSQKTETITVLLRSIKVSSRLSNTRVNRNVVSSIASFIPSVFKRPCRVDVKWCYNEEEDAWCNSVVTCGRVVMKWILHTTRAGDDGVETLILCNKLLKLLICIIYESKLPDVVDHQGELERLEDVAREIAALTSSSPWKKNSF